MGEEFAIPDVHADPDALRSMLELLPANPHVVFLGDIVNKGPSTLGAIELLRKASRNGAWKLLWGNHDILFVRAMLGSLDAQLKLFTQGSGTAIFSEIGQSQLGEAVCTVFAGAQTVGDPIGFLRKEPGLISDIDAAIADSVAISDNVRWMIDNFHLHHVSEKGILYIHAGIPLTPEGNARFTLDSLTRLSQRVSSDLRARDLDSTTFEELDRAEESPVRTIRWVNKIDRPKQFCKALGVKAIVVGHSEVSPDSISNEPFPVLRHDFGAASCKGDVPSVLQIDRNHQCISHVRIKGIWQQIVRGVLN